MAHAPTLVTALAVSYFVVAGVLFVGVPGLNFDESWPVSRVLTYLDQLPEAWRAADVQRILPPPLNTTEGSTLSALLALVIGIFGPSVVALRITSVLISTVTLLLVHRVCQRWIGAWAAAMTTALLATNSTFLLAAKLGFWWVEVFQLFFFWAAVLLARRFVDRPSVLRAVPLALTVGLAINAKIIALGYVAAFGLAPLLVGRGAFVRGLLRLAKPARAITFVLVTLGACAPYWLGSPGVGSHNVGETPQWSTADIWSTLGVRLDHLRRLYGSVLINDQLPEGDSVALFNPLWPLCLVGVLAVALWPRKERAWGTPRGWMLTLAVGYSVLFLLTLLVPFTATSNHLLVLVPGGEVLLGAAFGLALADRGAAPNQKPRPAGGSPRVLAWSLAAMALAVITVELINGAATLGVFASGRFNKAFGPPYADRIAEFLDAQQVRTVANYTDHAMGHLRVMGHGELEMKHDWTRQIRRCFIVKGKQRSLRPGCVEELFDTQLLHLLATRGQLHLLLQRNGPHWQQVARSFRDAALRHGKGLESLRTFDDNRHPTTISVVLVQ